MHWVNSVRLKTGFDPGLKGRDSDVIDNESGEDENDELDVYETRGAISRAHTSAIVHSGARA